MEHLLDSLYSTSQILFLSYQSQFSHRNVIFYRRSKILVPHVSGQGYGMFVSERPINQATRTATCASQKRQITKNKNPLYLNKRGEIAHKCRHKRSYLLQPPQEGQLEEPDTATGLQPNQCLRPLQREMRQQVAGNLQNSHCTRGFEERGSS